MKPRWMAWRAGRRADEVEIASAPAPPRAAAALSC